ncbi:MAG: ammonia channel protein [Alphaproteobacteria bacterium CG_4_10_14_0_8_um_filter_53_9]|nr:MAG: ammonia channel protein [Alphaproteobacteria bacterium CG_4_10_14_0_8_um_filter_53_9]
MNMLLQSRVAMRVLQVLVAAFAMMPAVAGAQEVAEINAGDTAWILTSSALVLLMTIPGLALFYGGLVRKKNVVSTLMQCFAICCLVSVLWVVVGYSIAFAPGSTDYFGGFGKVMLHGVTLDSVTGSIPELAFMMFQMTFAIITPALIIGSLVERMKFSGLLMFMSLWLLVVYCPIAYMVWGGGLMAKMGVLDFAGGAVVHINAGVAALVACLMLGKRREFGVNQELFKPNNITYTMMGASLLWVGWFGFNAGSALAANGQAAMAMANTQVAAAAAGLAWMFTEWAQRGKPSLVGLSCGAVAGLVAITPAAGFVGIDGALAIGILSGVLCLIGSTYLKHMLGYDDSLDVVGVHGIGGLVGAILVGVFAVEAVGGKSGLIEGNASQVMIQLMGTAITIGYAALMTFIIMLVTNMLMGIRVSDKDEDTGLDLSAHGESAQN